MQFDMNQRQFFQMLLKVLVFGLAMCIFTILIQTYLEKETITGENGLVEWME